MYERKERYFQLRLNEEERARLERQASKKGMTKSKYVLYLVDQDEKADKIKAGEKVRRDGDEIIRVYKDSDLNRLNWHLCHWGNNLNQGANALNRIANGRILSEARMVALFEKAVNTIEEAHTALVQMHKVVYDLKKEQHIVMNDRNR